MSEKLLEIKDLKVQYKSGDTPVCAVNGVNLTLEKGETLGLVGEDDDSIGNFKTAS